MTKRYEKYKPSGVEWIGEIPTEWDIHRLKTYTAKTINGVWGNEINHDENDIICIRVADFNMQSFSVAQDNLTLRNIEPSQQDSRL